MWVGAREMIAGNLAGCQGAAHVYIYFEGDEDETPRGSFSYGTFYDLVPPPADS